MKKNAMVFALLMLALPLAGCDHCKENPFTKMGDSIATMGKEGLEKQKILAERAATRASKCAEQEAGKMKKGLGL